MWNILIVILTVLIIICLWFVIYDSNRFVVREFSFEDSRIKKDFCAVVLADLHNKKYGRNNELLLKAIREAKPDMILVAGDLITALPGARFDTVFQLMEELLQDYPVYYGVGNHEQRLKLYPDVYGDMAARFEEGLGKLGIKTLENARVGLPEYGITIYGVVIDRFFYKRFVRHSMEPGYLESVLGAVDKSSYSILLAHNPDYFEGYAAWGADLTLAGHVHGGVVRLPFGGRGVISPSLRFFPKYDGGRFEQGKSVMLLSRGLGMHTIPIRLFNPAELLVVRFRGGAGAE